MQPVVKGMIQVAGATDRIVRTAHGGHGVTRVLHRAQVPTFSGRSRAKAISKAIDDRRLREIVRTATPSAKTTWVGRVALG
jgi:hypothetical protein